MGWARGPLAPGADDVFDDEEIVFQGLGIPDSGAQANITGIQTTISDAK